MSLVKIRDFFKTEKMSPVVVYSVGIVFFIAAIVVIWVDLLRDSVDVSTLILLILLTIVLIIPVIILIYALYLELKKIKERRNEPCC